jgi:hypothetical protein
MKKAQNIMVFFLRMQKMAKKKAAAKREAKIRKRKGGQPRNSLPVNCRFDSGV